MKDSIINSPENVIITPDELLTHLQGHRNLTRRVIEAFPEKDFFEYSIGGMRPFAEITKELLSMLGPVVLEMATGEKGTYPIKFDHGHQKKAFLALWDKHTNLINAHWPKIEAGRFHEKFIAFGQWEGTVLSTILYCIDNEIHHRGQGYVYLRALGIEPPHFWER